ncbi:Clp protease-domain-containing protein [Pavlovales sp. CCMP2436]|nr:Clp protease-domain-containing protein [Pavlovales sp. CCMP2436]
MVRLSFERARLALALTLLGVAQGYAPPSRAAWRADASPARASVHASTPMVPFKVPNSQYSQWVGVYDRMARERILFLGSPLDDTVTNGLIATLLFLENEDRKAPVNLYVNCPGALTKSGFALYDTMRTMAFPIGTLNLGMCAHMGAFICAAGTPGRRTTLPHSRYVLCSPSIVMPEKGEMPTMQAEDIKFEVAEVLKDRDRLVQGYSVLTGQSQAVVQQRLKRDSYFDAEEAKEWGLVDHILQPKTGNKAKSGDAGGFGAFNSAALRVEVTTGGGGGGRGGSGGEYEPQTA